MHLPSAWLLPVAVVAWAAPAPRQPELTWTPLESYRAGDDGCAGAAVSTDPATPRQGSFFRVRVEGVPASTGIRGTFAAEPLHFAEEGMVREAITAVPIDGASSATVVVHCVTESATDSVVTSLSLTTADYPLERLTVAPRFGAPPSAALAARMRREAALAAEVSRQAHTTPRLWRVPFRQPRESRVTSGFGSGREFNGAVTSRHMGTDYAGAVGAPVRAANRGVVRLVGAFFLGGNCVYVDHGAGIVTAYLHLSRVAVAVGDTVDRDTVIGRVGATGRVTGPHLHWITRYGGITADPASLLRVTAREGGTTEDRRILP